MEVIKNRKCPNCKHALYFSSLRLYEWKGQYQNGKLVYNKIPLSVGSKNTTLVGCPSCHWGGEDISNYEFDPPYDLDLRS